MLLLIAIFLLTAVIVVPLFRRLQLGSVLGYIAAGVLIGPWGLGLIPRAEGTLHVAELGVVLLLFLVGLELEPSRLWALRHSVFGLGGAQVVGCGVALGVVAHAFGLAWQPAIVVGFGLAMSSTAHRARVARRARAAEQSRRDARRSRSCCSRTSRSFRSSRCCRCSRPTGATRRAGGCSPPRASRAIAVVVIGSRLVMRPALSSSRATAAAKCSPRRRCWS